MPGGSRLGHGLPQPGGGTWILRADEYDAGGRADGVAGQGETLKHAVRVLFHEQAVRVRTRIAFIAVGHHHPGLRVFTSRPPFGRGAEAGTAPSPQLCSLDLGQNVLRRS
jgi:hypothetical protein